MCSQWSLAAGDNGWLMRIVGQEHAEGRERQSAGNPGIEETRDCQPTFSAMAWTWYRGRWSTPRLQYGYGYSRGHRECGNISTYVYRGIGGAQSCVETARYHTALALLSCVGGRSGVADGLINIPHTFRKPSIEQTTLAHASCQTAAPDSARTDHGSVG